MKDSGRVPLPGWQSGKTVGLKDLSTAWPNLASAAASVLGASISRPAICWASVGSVEACSIIDGKGGCSPQVPGVGGGAITFDHLSHWLIGSPGEALESWRK